MTTMHDILTEEQMSKFVINPEIPRYLELLREKLKLPRNQINVLDWGCGRGESVNFLRGLGYNACGVDICHESLTNGAEYLIKKGEDPAKILYLIDPQGKINFPDNFFHFIFSYQVLEHVEFIETVANEMNKKMTPDGMGLHIYPAHKRVIEGHLFMPFVHWLPKNKIRKLCIQFYVAAGIEPGWRELDGKTIREKTRRYYDYSINETFYRNSYTNKKIFEKNGLEVNFVIIDNPLLYKYSLIRSLMKFGPLKKLVNWGLLNGMSVEMLTTKTRPPSLPELT